MVKSLHVEVDYISKTHFSSSRASRSPFQLHYIHLWIRRYFFSWTVLSISVVGQGQDQTSLDNAGYLRHSDHYAVTSFTTPDVSLWSPSAIGVLQLCNIVLLHHEGTAVTINFVYSWSWKERDQLHQAVYLWSLVPPGPFLWSSLALGTLHSVLSLWQTTYEPKQPCISALNCI